MTVFRKFAAGLTVAGAAFAATNASADVSITANGQTVTVSNGSGQTSCSRTGRQGTITNEDGTKDTWTVKPNGAVVLDYSNQPSFVIAPDRQSFATTLDSGKTVTVKSGDPLDQGMLNKLVSTTDSNRSFCKSVLAKSRALGL